jgi:hypothetical protein
MKQCPACGHWFQRPDDECPRCGHTGEDVPTPRPPRRRTSKLAIAALVVSLAGPLVWLVTPMMGVNRSATAWQRVLPLYVILSGGLFLGLIASIWILAGRKRRAGLDLAVLSVLVSAFGLLIVAPVTYSAEISTHQAECRSNLEQVGLALQMYARDYHALPPADRWSDSLLPYTHSRDIFVCPEAPRQRSAYAFNRAFAGMSAGKFLKLPQLAGTVLLYESDLGWNGAGGPETITARPRHRGQDTFAFADGQVRFRKRGQQSDLIWRPAR